MKLGAP